MTERDLKNAIKRGVEQIKPDSEFRTRIINKEFKRKKRIVPIKTAGVYSMSAVAAAAILFVVLHNPASEQMIVPGGQDTADRTVPTEMVMKVENASDSKQDTVMPVKEKGDTALNNKLKSTNPKQQKDSNESELRMEQNTGTERYADEKANEEEIRDDLYSFSMADLTAESVSDSTDNSAAESDALANERGPVAGSAALKQAYTADAKNSITETAPMAAGAVMESAAVMQSASLPPYTVAMAVLAEYNYNNSKLEYYQSDITDRVKLSDDMRYNGSLKYESEAEYDKEYRLYNYTGDNGRYVNIVSSKDTEYVDAVLDMDEVPNTSVEDIPVEDSGDNEYFFYMHVEDTGLVVNSKGLEKTENQDLLYSLGGE